MRKGVMIASALSAVSILLLIAATPAPAGTIKDLGTAGTVYSIIEPDLLAELRQYALTHTPSPEKQQQERAHYQPKDLRRLPKATADRSFEVDMTYTLTHEVTDGSGHVLYPRGFKVNPLQYVNFTGGLVVIDGSDPRQVEWFEKSPYYPNKLAILLISGGYAFELTSTLKRPVYYLTGEIADRFRLAAVPSIVVRKGNGMSVREVKIEK